MEDSSFQDRYVALSHRWATSCCPQALKTTNLQQYQASIPTSQLPQNFIDAIAITEVLGLTYLWIDCLCIIQDSTIDWEIESAKMDAVYLNATVTIAAGAAEDANQGCAVDLAQPPSLRLKLPLKSIGKGSKTCVIKGTLRSAYASAFTIYDCPISKRGWVLQEMALSPRILHFTQDQVYWQCRERVDSEDGTLSSSDTEHGTGAETLRESLDRVLLTPNTIPEDNLPCWWWTWAVDYSSRAFTKMDDKLYAYAGITKFYRRLPGSSEIVLGLLRGRLLNDLWWGFTHTKPHRRITATKLPSWSWLGWEATLLPTKWLFMENDWPQLAQATLLSVDVVWSGQELTTALKKAEIKISGRILPMQIGAVITFGMEGYTTNLVFLDDTKPLTDTGETIKYVAKANFDIAVPPEARIVQCLELEAFWSTVNLEPSPSTNPPWSPVFQVTQKLLVLGPVDT